MMAGKDVLDPATQHTSMSIGKFLVLMQGQYCIAANIEFSPYFRKHGLQVPVVLFPHGRVGHIFVPSRVQSNWGVLNMSDVRPELGRLLRSSQRPNGRLPALHGDVICAPRSCWIPRYVDPDAREYRVTVRFSPLHIYGEHTVWDFHSLCTYVYDTYQVQLLSDGDVVRNILSVGFFVLNCSY